MDNQFLTIVSFAGFSGFVAGVVLTWLIAKRVAFQKPEPVPNQFAHRDKDTLKRLADSQAQQAHTLAEAQRLAQSATGDMAKAAELLRQAEGALRNSTQELNAMSLESPKSGRASSLESEPLRPRAARA
jgi:hypothetical protein